MTTAEVLGTTPTTEIAIVEDLRTTLRGRVLDRDHPDYDGARRVWNGLIDRRPAVIATCADTADVVEAVRVARRHRPTVSIRGGGHQVPGSAVCDDGLVIDLSAMTAVHVDPTARTARVQAGATWGHVDRATQLFGLAVPGGEVSQTGVAGFTLGGGMGALMRAHGLACDNLRSIELVTADGAVRTASRQEHPDLFWAARGGGRGLGVVTSFEFELQPLGPQVAVAQVLYPYSDAAQVLRGWRDLVRLPDTVSPQVVLWSIPADPAIPAGLHESKAVFVLGMYAGPADGAHDALAPLAQLGTPLADESATTSYVAAQSAVDAAFPAGGRYYFKSHFLDALPDEAIETMLACDARRPNRESLIVIRTVGGAIARVADEDSSYAHRAATFNLSVDAGWADPAMDAEAIGWARSSWDALAPFATGGIYVNFAGLGGETEQATVYGASAERLGRIRRAYDPDGIFDGAASRP